MIIYNVTVTLDLPIEAAWVSWMTDEHMPELMNTGLFLKYQLCKLITEEDLESASYVAQYYLADWADYETYIEAYAPQMRARGLAKFGDQIMAFRTVMKVIV